MGPVTCSDALDLHLGPTLLYGALVWWQATEKTTYTELMERIQRQALVCITGALKSTPTKALETILGVDPIDIQAQLTAGKAAQRLVASGNMTAQSFGNSSIGLSMINKTDHMTPRTCPEVKTTSFMGLDDWKTGRDQTQHLNIYTDGSKMEGGVGAGLYCTDPEIRLSFKLPNDCSIFQAEVFAIRKAAEGIDGNETADVLAKEGVELANDRTENVPVSLRTLQSALEKQEDTRAKSRWRNTKTCQSTANSASKYCVYHGKTADC
ncbi:uncharacterized protein [Drosophila takahashii]|uniref:uncharacterized protein n=1 Tax=Drosophila takahashii TaxID=29030 RepID=UPI003898F75B